MAKEYAKSFYKSKAWRECRASYIAKRHGLCERCEGAGNTVHHKTYITPENINDPNITLNHDNLELLCPTCHQLEHHEKHSPVRWGLMFDSNGQIIQRG